MRTYLLVGVGGALGALARSVCSGWVSHNLPGWNFPLPTFTVNILGCLAAGLLTGLAERWGIMSLEVRLLLFTGILGGFTTFSAFTIESALLLKKGELFIALLYMVLSVTVGLFAFVAGLSVTKGG